MDEDYGWLAVAMGMWIGVVCLEGCGCFWSEYEDMGIAALERKNLFCVVIQNRIFLSQEISVEYLGPCGYGGGQSSISHPDWWSFQAGNKA